MHCFLLVSWPHRVVELSHLMDSDAFPVLAVLGPLVAPSGLVVLAHLLVAAAHGVPHPRVLRPGEYSPAVVVECIVVHVLEFVGLPQAIPSPKILGVNLDSIAIGLDGARYILHLKVLMAHKGPGSKASPVQLKRLPEVDNGLEMLAHQGIVVANDTAGFRHILIVIKLFQGEISQLPLILLDVQNIGIGVHVLEPVGVYLEQLLEPFQTDVEFWAYWRGTLVVVEGVGDLVHYVVRVLEEAQDTVVQLDAHVVPVLLEAERAEVEVL